MAYDEELAERIRDTIGDLGPFTEQKMFGGLAFLDRGRMTVGVMGADLIVRVGPDAKDAALARPGVREFDFTGRPMRAFVVVAREALDDAALAGWIDQARTFALSLPAKSR
jgi:TfoX/Sxy family transcriptional regulator of competence genes